MKIIITGATGFIGRNFAESLHKKGYDVLATGRSQYVGQQLEKTGITFKKADILNQDELKEVFTQADFLIHCAGKSADWGKYSEFYLTNVIGTGNVINTCKRHNINNIIFISTPSVYYSGKDRFDISESEPLPGKQFGYGRTKLIAESELLNLEKDGFKTIILRPRAVYGQYDNTIVPRILKMSEQKRFPLIDGGSAKIDITYIDNLTQAVIDCLAAPEKAWNQVYNISNGEPLTVKEWFSIVLEIFNLPFNPKNISASMARMVAGTSEFISSMPFGNKKPQLTRFSVGYMSKSLTMSIKKAKQNLGYYPQISNEEGFELYKKWYNSDERIQGFINQIS